MELDLQDLMYFQTGLFWWHCIVGEIHSPIHVFPRAVLTQSFYASSQAAHLSSSPFISTERKVPYNANI